MNSMELISQYGLLAIGIAAMIILLIILVSVIRRSVAAPGIAQSIARAKRSRANFNMLIAHTHRGANQIVGIQLSGANVIAQLVSACSIVAGTVTFATQNMPGAWLLWLAAGLVGVMLAYLIEGLTLSNLIKIRLVNRAIKKAESELVKERDQLIAAEQRPRPGIDFKAYKSAMKAYRMGVRWIEREYRRKRHQVTRDELRQRRMAFCVMILGASASAAGGGLFYHAIFANLGLWSFALSGLLAFIVTGTFVSNELHKDLQEQAIREGFAGGELTDAAMMEETKRLSTQIVHEGILYHLQSEEAQAELKGTSISILRDIIRKLRPEIPQTTIQIEGSQRAQIEQSSASIWGSNSTPEDVQGEHVEVQHEDEFEDGGEEDDNPLGRQFGASFVESEVQFEQQHEVQTASKSPDTRPLPELEALKKKLQKEPHTGPVNLASVRSARTRKQGSQPVQNQPKASNQKNEEGAKVVIVKPAHGDAKEAVWALLTEDPDMKGAEIKRRTGLSTGSVSTYRKLFEQHNAASSK